MSVEETGALGSLYNIIITIIIVIIVIMIIIIIITTVIIITTLFLAGGMGMSVTARYLRDSQKPTVGHQAEVAIVYIIYYYNQLSLYVCVYIYIYIYKYYEKPAQRRFSLLQETPVRSSSNDVNVII